MQETLFPHEGTASNLSLLSVGVLSYRAHQTIQRTLELHRKSGLTKLAAEFFVYFNALCPEDEQLAQAAGVAYRGSPENSGIYGGFRAIAELAARPYVLILENDIIPLEGVDIAACLDSCLSDMREHGIKVFCLRSRAFPGQGGVRGKICPLFPNPRRNRSTAQAGKTAGDKPDIHAARAWVSLQVRRNRDLRGEVARKGPAARNSKASERQLSHRFKVSAIGATNRSWLNGTFFSTQSAGAWRKSPTRALSMAIKT